MGAGAGAGDQQPPALTPLHCEPISAIHWIWAAVTASRDAARELAEFFTVAGSRQPAEPFFVKDLEQVRGDERDALIVSVGYGRQPPGRTRYQWGPPRRGERGQQLAAARARYRFTVVSCGLAADEDKPAAVARPAGLAITVGPPDGPTRMIVALDGDRHRW